MRLNDTDKDYAWTADGDLFPGNNEEDRLGLIGLDTSIRNRMLESVLLRRLMSNSADWRDLDPSVGVCANLSDFAGLPVNEETATLLKSRILGVLSLPGGSGYVSTEVECYPDPSNNSIFVVITVPPIDPDPDGEPVVMGLSYDTRDNKIIPRITNI